VFVTLYLRVFRVGVSAAIQSPFRDAIQMLNLGVRNVRKSKRPRNVETPSEAFRKMNEKLIATLHTNLYPSC